MRGDVPSATANGARTVHLATVELRNATEVQAMPTRWPLPTGKMPTTFVVYRGQTDRTLTSLRMARVVGWLWLSNRLSRVPIRVQANVRATLPEELVKATVGHEGSAVWAARRIGVAELVRDPSQVDRATATWVLKCLSSWHCFCAPSAPHIITRGASN